MNFKGGLSKLYSENKNLKFSVSLLFFCNIYLIANIFLGNNSIGNYRKMRNEKLEKSHSLHQISEENSIYEAEINMLSNANLNVDYLEELARSQLNYSYPDEKVIIYSKNKF